MRSLTRIWLVFLFIVQVSLVGFAQSGVISTVAGNGTQDWGDGGLATSARLYDPTGVAVDSGGNLYISEFNLNRIRKVTPSGTISTVAGDGKQGYRGDGGLATSAELCFPSGVAVDSGGNLYIADRGTNRIRKVTPSGTISTVAGNGNGGYSGDGGLATSAELYAPSGVAVDSGGNLYIAAPVANRIRKVTPSGTISTVAGNGIQGYSGDGGLATSAELYAPWGVAVDSGGNLYIADSGNERIRKVAPSGTISTVAGNGTLDYSGDGGLATSAELYQPYGVAVDSGGNLYIADSGNERIRKVAPSGTISTVAGNGTQGYSGDGGLATSAELSYPYGVAVDSGGNLYIADTGNDRIRMVTGVASVTYSATTFFPQVAVGGGSSTLFTITNTGSTAASGNLILTNQQGNPFTVSGVLTDSSGTIQPASVGSSFSIYVPAGGTVFLSANALNPNNPTSSGWAELDSTGGSLTGVATYEYVSGGILQYVIGVLQSPLLQFATIPMDNDNTQAQQMAYAIANPSSQTISIKLALVGQDGTVVDDTVTVTLSPGQQIARYLWQDLPARTNFKGSLVLRGQAGASFTSLLLLQKQSLFTVIPLISGKAPGIPD
jgi:sugar lactone lactonase YvrE